MPVANNQCSLYSFVKMKYFLILSVLIAINFINEGYTQQTDDDDDDDEVTCLKCKSSSFYECRIADEAGPTCFGKYCYSYIYRDTYKTLLGGEGSKLFYIRGCTDEADFCDGESHLACSICSEEECNNKKLPPSP
ncbi:uncharacterized protein LOC123306302 [Coccinella septempunctata]|uniref:uncharacterized protein LOC123306302 n=1 Tax=Coccinella septempunctata TaxID=41139 RepID=UPI001D091ECA|nr:uncharacterized protein LOC123306302 [Coccinella septempunctata]